MGQLSSRGRVNKPFCCIEVPVEKRGQFLKDKRRLGN